MLCRITRQPATRTRYPQHPHTAAAAATETRMASAMNIDHTTVQARACADSNKSHMWKASRPTQACREQSGRREDVHTRRGGDRYEGTAGKPSEDRRDGCVYLQAVVLPPADDGGLSSEKVIRCLHLETAACITHTHTNTNCCTGTCPHCGAKSPRARATYTP